MSPPEKIRRIIEIFEKINPDPKTELHYRTPYELFVAVVLSAQCTDARVNEVTPSFFKEYPDFTTLAAANPEEVARTIRSITYPNSKSQSLVKAAREVIQQHGGMLPRDFDALRALPGVGRKTANVLLSVLYNAPTLPVDTHVFRVSKRLGLVPQSTPSPEATEQLLLKIVPPEYRGKFHHWIILHGRYICKARKPLCDRCPLTDICDEYRGRMGS